MSILIATTVCALSGVFGACVLHGTICGFNFVQSLYRYPRSPDHLEGNISLACWSIAALCAWTVFRIHP